MLQQSLYLLHIAAAYRIWITNHISGVLSVMMRYLPLRICNCIKKLPHVFIVYGQAPFPFDELAIRFTETNEKSTQCTRVFFLHILYLYAPTYSRTLQSWFRHP